MPGIVSATARTIAAGLTPHVDFTFGLWAKWPKVQDYSPCVMFSMTLRLDRRRLNACCCRLLLFAVDQIGHKDQDRHSGCNQTKVAVGNNVVQAMK